MANFFDQFDAPSIDPRARDLVVRTMIGEAANEPDEGLAGVASVIRNRLNSGQFGKSLPEVVLSKNQFEPWNTPAGRQKMMSYAPQSETYQRANAIFDKVFTDGYDPTGGATHFFAPQAQAALGRRPPRWAQGDMRQIGGHNFYAPGGKLAQAEEMSARSANFFDQFDEPNAQQQAGPAAGNAFDQFDAPAGPDFAGTFDAAQQGQRPEMQAPMQQAAQDMTRGPQVAPGAQMATDFMNVVPAASQGTTPNVDAYRGKLVSNEAFEDETGAVLYRDPQTGQVRPTDSKTQVAIRDPADGAVKIFERSESTNEGSAVGVARALAPGLAAGAPTARPAIGIAAAKNVQPKASDIFSTAKPLYRAFKNEAGKIGITAEDAAAMGGRLRDSLSKANLIPELAPPVYSAVAILDKGKPITLDALQNVKRVVGRGFNSPDKNVRDAAAVASGEIVKIISEVSKSAARNLKTGDQIHSTARSVQDLQRKGAVAQLRAGRAGYGGNSVNTMRQVLSPIVQRAVEGRMTGFKPDEIQAMRDIVEGTTATNALRGVGQLSPSKGIIQTAASVGATVALGPAALAIPALGMASNKLATVLTGKQIDRLSMLVAKRSPAYAAGVAKAVERYNRSQLEFATSPSPNKFAAYLSSSRALAAGLQKDGIEIASGDLLRMLQSPMKSAADDEEQPVPRGPSE